MEVWGCINGIGSFGIFDSKENGAGFSDWLRKGRIDGGTEEKVEHVLPHSLVQRQCSMLELMLSSSLYWAYIHILGHYQQ